MSDTPLARLIVRDFKKFLANQPLNTNTTITIPFSILLEAYERHVMATYDFLLYAHETHHPKIAKKARKNKLVCVYYCQQDVNEDALIYERQFERKRVKVHFTPYLPKDVTIQSVIHFLNSYFVEVFELDCDIIKINRGKNKVVLQLLD